MFIFFFCLHKIMTNFNCSQRLRPNCCLAFVHFTATFHHLLKMSTNYCDYYLYVVYGVIQMLNIKYEIALALVATDFSITFRQCWILADVSFPPILDIQIDSWWCLAFHFGLVWVGFSWLELIMIGDSIIGFVVRRRQIILIMRPLYYQ